MTKYDHDGDKVTSEGPDGFLVVDFSRFKDIWSDVANGEEPEEFTNWDDFSESLPEEDKPEQPVDLRRYKRMLDVVENMDIVDDAKAYRNLRDKPAFIFPKGYDGAELEDLDFPDTPYTVADLWPSGGNVLFAAPAKFGKSTTVMNLLRSLLTGHSFLNFFRCTQIPDDEAILLIDLEMPETRIRSEVLGQEIPREIRRKLKVFPLQGLAEQFDITNPEVFEYWVEYCLAHNVKTLVIDPLAPLMGLLAIDENDNSQVTQFFEKLGSFKKKAGIRDMMVVHHCGHSADWRPRGASRFNDWADSLWLARINGPVNDPASPREFFCRGRDVWQTLFGEGTVTVDPTNAKKLIFDSQSGSAQQTLTAIQGEIENLFSGTPKLVRWDLNDDTNKKADVITKVVNRLVANDPAVNTNKVETVLDKMAADQFSIHCHQFNPVGVAGRPPWRVYPADHCPVCP